MSTKIVIPYYTDETATAWCNSIGDYVEGQLTSTNEQLRNLADALEVKLEDGEPFIMDVILDETGLSFDRIAIIDPSFQPVLENQSNHAIGDNGSDSGWYTACKAYNQLLVDLADFTLPI